MRREPVAPHLAGAQFLSVRTDSDADATRAPERNLILGKFLTEAATAAELGVHLRTLRRWDAAGTGPRRLRIGKRRVVYAVRDLEQFIENGGVPPIRPMVRRRRRVRG